MLCLRHWSRSWKPGSLRSGGFPEIEVGIFVAENPGADGCVGPEVSRDSSNVVAVSAASGWMLVVHNDRVGAHVVDRPPIIRKPTRRIIKSDQHKKFKPQL